MKKNVIMALLFVVLLGCVFFATKQHYSKQEPIEVIKKIPIVKTIEKDIQISGETIRASMSNIGELCTAEYSYTHVERVDSSRKIKDFEIPFTKSTFIYSYDGVVKAGIDFTEIQINKNEMEKTITVTLPNVYTIGSNIDHDSFQLYDEKNNIFNPISVTDVTDSIADLEDSEEKKAIEKGLYDRAKESAKLLVENFMHGSYDVEDYEIEVLFEQTSN